MQSDGEANEPAEITHDYFQKRLGRGVADHHKTVEPGDIVSDVDKAAERHQGEAAEHQRPAVGNGFKPSPPGMPDEDRYAGEYGGADTFEDQVKHTMPSRLPRRGRGPASIGPLREIGPR